jgi:hypothetical protein
VGFLLLMLGCGLRLDTTWEGAGLVLMLAGAAGALAGLVWRTGHSLPSIPAPRDNAPSL